MTGIKWTSGPQGLCGSCGSGQGHNEGRCRNCGGPFSPKTKTPWRPTPNVPTEALPRVCFSPIVSLYMTPDGRVADIDVDWEESCRGESYEDMHDPPTKAELDACEYLDDRDLKRRVLRALLDPEAPT